MMRTASHPPPTTAPPSAETTRVAAATMPAVLLDANAYRGMGRERFDALVELERQRQVTRYAEPFAVMELLAHLLDRPETKTFRSCRASLGRVFRRCAGD